MATDMTASGSPEEKLRWAFKMYDKDGSGQSMATITILCFCLSVLSIVGACINKQANKYYDTNRTMQKNYLNICE